MDAINLVFWLQGFLEDRESLTKEEIFRVKTLLDQIVDVPKTAPPEQVEKMLNKLFPESSFINGNGK